METLNLMALQGLVNEMPEYHRLIADLKQSNKPANASIIDAAKPFLIAVLHQTLHRPIMVITARAENSRQLYEQLCLWNDPAQVRLLPEPDALPYERITTDSYTELERLRILSVLSQSGNTNPLVVVSAHAFALKQPDHSQFASVFSTIKEGMSIEPSALMKRWQTIGYQTESLVEIPGTMGRRGGILDIYPPTDDLPVRLEFFGNIVDSIRLFDPTNQRSQQKVASVTVGPAIDLLSPFTETSSDSILSRLDFSNCSADAKQRFTGELSSLIRGQKVGGRDFYATLFNHDSLLTYLPENALLVLDEPLGIQRAMEDLDEKARELRAGLLEQGELPTNFPIPNFTWEEIQPFIDNKSRLHLATWGFTETNSVHKLPFSPVPSYAGQLPTFINRVKESLAKKRRVIIISHQSSRLSELFEEEDIIATPLTTIRHTPLAGSVTLIQGLLAQGWSIDGNASLFTDNEIFGFTKQQRFQKKRPVARHKVFADIKPGDYVVHIEHGIGQLTGFTVMKANGNEREYLVLQYAAGDRLYVPTDQVDRVSRYVGGGEHSPVLSRLGTQEWTRTKQKIKEATEEVARDLLDLYANREVVTGHAFPRDSIWQKELEASFPYVETPDQITAQQEIKEDMEKTKPMDRLVCGDVGYGKTEVAIRAAFKAVMDGKQVAVLVPTTVLAQQHFVTFSQRMKAFPVRVDVLSRFRSPKEQKAVIEGLADGSVDICIGTHRLLQKDVKLKDLGLLIVDEEQRFGVAHKEYLKKMRQEVDVLTLSATPIPRTLHMSLVSVRDMSTMETPPEDRLPITTYVAEYNDRLVRDAILREVERNGQAFFVHNRVQSIDLIAERLRRLVPEARIIVGHGQMHEGELERVTGEFIKGNYDVLVCTTIIESGLDMPNVNTLIVNQSDRLGLSQLYQLRGRVGRGATIAYAYFLFDRGKRLTAVAEKRLRTIYEATELGAGFGIAMKDLEIRGAGNLLGVRQSGNISAIGFNLYCQLLASAVENLKARRAGAPIEKISTSKLPSTSIDLPLPALIPEDYVSDVITRLELYQRLSEMTGPGQIPSFVQEMTDRFGPPPDEVNNLLDIVRIKSLASKAGFESITTETGDVVLRLFEGMRFDLNKLAPFQRFGIRIGNTVLRVPMKQPGGGWTGIKRVLEEMLSALEINSLKILGGNT